MFRSLIIYPFITLIACLTISSCNYFASKSKELKEDPIAKVNDLYLYPSDLNGLSANTDKQDSIKLVQMFVTDWIKRNLLLEKAKQSSSSKMKEIDEKVESYKQSLILYNYENDLLAQMQDTMIDIAAKEQYYNNFQNNFILDEDVYQFQFIVLPGTTAQIEDWMKEFGSSKDEDRVNLNSKVKIAAIKSETSLKKWFSREDISKQLSLSADFFTKLKANGSVQKLDNNSQIILYKLNAVKPAGEVAPFDRVDKTINQILLNKKKTELLNKIYNEIYDAGIQSKNAEDFTISKNKK